MDEEIILNRNPIFTHEISFGFQASFHFPLVPRGHILLSSTTKVCKNAARGLGVLLTPPFVWFRDHILTIESKFGGDGGVSFLVGLLPILLGHARLRLVWHALWVYRIAFRITAWRWSGEVV